MEECTQPTVFWLIICPRNTNNILMVIFNASSLKSEPSVDRENVSQDPG